MRMIVEKVFKSAPKKQKMKLVNSKKKKSLPKSSTDTISETISFVINGHLPPLKSAVLSKKSNVAKKNLKLLSKTRAAETAQKQQNAQITKKNRDSRKVKTTIKKDTVVKVNNNKLIKETSTPRKQKKKNSPEILTTGIRSDAELGKSAANHIEKQNKKSLKSKATTPKTETRSAKKQGKTDLVLRQKSPVKYDTSEKENLREKNLEVSAKKAKKVSNARDRKPVAIKHKLKVNKTKEIKIKPKKSPVSSIEHKSVKEDVKAVSSKVPKSNVNRSEVQIKTEVEKKSKYEVKKHIRKKIKVEDAHLSTDDNSSTSDEITLDELRHNSTVGVKKEVNTPTKKKSSKLADTDKNKQKRKLIKTPLKHKALIKKNVLKNKKSKKLDQRSRKLKLYGFWNGPKRHRVASLNALAKVHCLYENETRGALIDSELIKSELVERKIELKEEDDDIDDVPPTRTLRSAPGLRGVGKHWEMHDEAFSSSEDNESVVEANEPDPEIKPERKKPYVKRKRNRCELVMDLKDMVVRKRMASLNASAILAASYSVEKRSSKSPKSEYTDSEDSGDSFIHPAENKKKCTTEEDTNKEDDRKVIEVQATPNKKVSVILNQDTDVTITGVYVNSTTRSTHHEGYCSIAGMQYRISAKSHTQTASTTVATETILQSAANIGQENVATETCKSYAPLTALSSMQPPGTPNQHAVPVPSQHSGAQQVIPLSTAQHIPPTSPISRRHGCTSAFSAPPAPYGPPLPAHHSSTSAPPTDPNYIHETKEIVHPFRTALYNNGYYQPAGPLINVPQHGQLPSSSNKTAPLSEVSSSPTPPPAPPSHQTHSQSSTTDSLDSDVIITSTTTPKEVPPPQQPLPPPLPTYRYSQYPAPHPGYAYGYPPQYYPSPHAAPYHHDLCYPNPYLHHKPYPPPTFRRHLTAPAGTQYYQANPPDLYHPPPTASTQQNQQVVTASTNNNGTYQPSSSGPPPPLMETYPPPPTLVESYPPPPHYYPGYGPAPPPPCYTHSPPTRTLPYLNATYQTCPCPMQSCPKNVHTGPLTGDSKRSSHITSIAKDSLPLPPVALALPLEPVSATGPPSPARGSAGMPPPPSPAGATYQPLPPAPKQEEIESLDCKPDEKRRKARIGKTMVRNNIAANFPQNTMLLMCHQPLQQNLCLTSVKREIESPEEIKVCLTEVLSSKIEKPELSSYPDKNRETIILSRLKTEDETSIETFDSADKNSKSNNDEHLPCQKTVAENVKVKNMKRKLSITKDSEKSEADIVSPAKKLKMEKVKVNGSYKDLIKKNVPSIKINNGKRKLNIEVGRTILIKNSKLKFRKSAIKRKFSSCKEDLISKRLKVLKPLIASNLHNSKQNLKINKGKCFTDFELSENKEPSQKGIKKLHVNSKNSVNNKKLAPAILDNLFSRNNVDRTIECVINRYSENSRTNNKKTDSSKLEDKCKKLKATNNKQDSVSIKSTNNNINSGLSKSKIIIAKKIGASKRKSKRRSVEVAEQTIQKVPRRQLQIPKWSNGWTWKGEPYQAKIFLNSDETIVQRKCYPAMMHVEGDTIEPRDCVLLKAGPRRNDLPFVAKVAALWENPEDGEMMMSLLWYYRPEHTEQGRQDYDELDEVFASRHKDTNSVACIEDKCYVLTFNEYCRYRKSLKRIEEGLEDTITWIPNLEQYPRISRQPPSTFQTPHDLVFFCRRVYDFRQKRIVKNPS